MTVWSRPGQEGDQVVDRRAGPHSPVELRWRAVVVGEKVVQRSGIATFEHRDNRIWNCRIMPLPDDNPFAEMRCEYSVHMTTGGMPPIVFLSKRIEDARRVSLRFANLAMEQYKTLVTMAEPTLDHPRVGDEVEIRITHTDGEHEYRTARTDGVTLELYPTLEQALGILNMITDVSTYVGMEQNEDSIALRRSERGQVRRIELTPAEERNPRRQFGAVAEAFDTLITTPDREERRIDL